jgi:hypothetical protein
MLVPVVAVLIGAICGFTGSRRLRRPQEVARAASVARSVGAVGRRRTLTAPELQRACFSEMVRHVQVDRRGQTTAPSRYVLHLSPVDLEVVDEGRRWFTDGLVEALRTAARDNGWHLTGAIEIAYEADPSRRPGVPSASAVAPGAPAETAPSAPPPSPSAAASAGLVLRRADTGETIPLGADVVTIGRSRDRTISVTDDRVSRSHARIEPAGGGWAVVDEGSSNGTKVGGAPLVAGAARALRAGDVVSVGPVDIHVEQAAAPEPAPGTRALDDHTRTRISGEVLPPRREDRR